MWANVTEHVNSSQDGSRPMNWTDNRLGHRFYPLGGKSKLCLKPHLIRHKSNKSLVPIAFGFLDLRQQHKQIWKHRLHLPDVFSRRRRLGRSRISSLKSCHGPKLVFIWYEIYFSSRSVQEQPIWEEALFAPCLSSVPVCLLLSLVHFKGIAMMRALKGGNLSMYQICWEASESEVQLHRHRAQRGETGLRTSEVGGEGARNFLFCEQLSIVCDRVQKVHCHYFSTYKYLMLCYLQTLPCCFTCLFLFVQHANQWVIYSRRWAILVYSPH